LNPICSDGAVSTLVATDTLRQICILTMTIIDGSPHPLNDCYGSIATEMGCPRYVRFSPRNGHREMSQMRRQQAMKPQPAKPKHISAAAVPGS